MFWLLITMGMATFAPCVLLPEWREYQQIRLAEQAEQHRLDEMRRYADGQKILLEGLQGDPAVIARIARRDLRYFQPGERAVAVNMPRQATDQASTFTPQTPMLPSAVARLEEYLPDYRYDALFCEPGTRSLMMALSLGLIATAIGVFWTRPQPFACPKGR